MENKKIVLYTTSECPYCNELKKLLNKDNIHYTDVDVNKEENEEEWEKIVKFSDNDMVPVITVNENMLIPEKSFTTIKDAFKIIKSLS